MNHKLYSWWKTKHTKIRKPVVFVAGVSLVIVSPIVGAIPGPGGAALFLVGIGVLATEFNWALQLRDFFLKTVPKQMKDRWRPTPRWQTCFDATALALLMTAIWLALNHLWIPTISFTATGICLALFNRNRLTRLKQRLRRQ